MRQSATTVIPAKPEGTLPASQAIRQWSEALGEHKINLDNVSRQPFETNETASNRSVVAVLKPDSADDVANIVRVANRFRIPLYPVSTGKNWGYGGASPAQSGCAIVDLSGLRQIVEFDDELGLVTVEPGVT